LAAPAVIRSLQPHHVPYLAGLPGVLTAIVAVPELDEDVIRAAREELDGQS
jgi:hypothetical protein